MKLADVMRDAIEPALALLPAQLASDEARVMLLAIGMQESRFTFHSQVNGPARGFWQFEEGGGVRGVMEHLATKRHAQALCAARSVPWLSARIHQALAYDDVLAAGFARLLLLADPRALPALDADHEEAWQCYARNWNPGRPHRQTWDAFHHEARQVIIGAAL